MAKQKERQKLPAYQRLIASNIPLRGILLVCLFFSTLALLLVLLYQIDLNNVHKNIADSLSSVTALRKKQVEEWKQERLAESRFLLNNQTFIALVRDYFKEGPGSPLEAQVRDWLASIRANHDYQTFVLTDNAGTARFTVQAKSGSLPLLENLFSAIKEAQERNEPLLKEFRIPSTHIDMALITPLSLDQGEAGIEKVGAIVFYIDLHNSLFPLVQGWPVKSRTAEVLLCQRETDRVLFLNELRFKKNSAMTYSLPLSQKSAPAVQAALGKKGVLEGIDYRGKPVLAAVDSLQDPDWFIISKVDKEELVDHFREKLVLLLLIFIVSGGIGFSVILLRWWKKDLKDYHSIYETANKKATLSAHYEFLLAYATDAILLLNADGKVLEFNHKATELYGYSPEEFESLTLRDLYSSRAPRTPEEDLALNRKTSSGSTFETIHRKKDGCDIQVEISSGVIATEKDSPSFQFIIRDITQRKYTEMALFESEERFRKIFEESHLGIALAGTSHLFIKANQRFCQITGYSEEELTQLSFADITHPEDAGKSLELNDKLLRGEIPFYQLEKRYVRKDKRIVWVNLNVSAIRNPGENIPFSLGMVQDITEQRDAAEQNIKLFRAVEQSPATVMITDKLGNIEYVNPKFTETTGYSFAEVLGKNPRLLKSGKQSPSFYKDLWETILAEKEWRGEFQNKKKNGEIFWEDAVISAIKDKKGQIVNFIAVKQNITEQKKIEGQFLQAQKMEAIGRLASGVAHDFNNLLTVIMGYSQLLVSRLQKTSPSSVPDLLEIQKASERATYLTRQLLAFSRKQIYQPSSVDINQLIQDLGKMIVRLIGEDITLETRFAPDLKPIWADIGQLEQALINLVINARDAMPEGGKLTLETTAISSNEALRKNAPDAGTHPEGVQIAITDTGTGMSEETRSHLFEPFFTTKAKGKGTGLGLSTVYGIVERAGGIIQCESEPGNGTTFRICLPVSDRPVSPAPSQTPPQEGKRIVSSILIVEDEIKLRQLAVQALSAYGHEVYEASNGVEALQKLQQGDIPMIDVVITDMLMPQMRGDELIRHVRKLRPQTKFLLISGYMEHEVIEKEIQNGTPFLAKPFTPLTLLAKVNELFKTS